MPKLSTANVFVDTEAFDAAKLNLTTTAFKTLLEHSRRGRIKLFCTTVTLGEIKNHIAEQVATAISGLKKLKTSWWFLHNLPFHELRVIFPKVEKSTLVAAINARLVHYLEEAEATILDLRDANADSVFDRYFNVKPPFSEGKKKSEFPDAFALAILDGWCNRNNESMYVISNDSDWRDTCADSKCLLHLDSLDKFLDLVVQDVEERRHEKAVRLFNASTSDVHTVIRSAFHDRSFYLDQEEGEVDDVIVEDVELTGDPSVLTVTDAEAKLNVGARVKFEAEVTIYDRHSGYYDKEDSRWITLPTRRGTVQRSQDVQAEVTLIYDEHTDEVESVFCNVDVDPAIFVPSSEWENWEINFHDDPTITSVR